MIKKRKWNRIILFLIFILVLLFGLVLNYYWEYQRLQRIQGSINNFFIKSGLRPGQDVQVSVNKPILDRIDYWEVAIEYSLTDYMISRMLDSAIVPFDTKVKEQLSTPGSAILEIDKKSFGVRCIYFAGRKRCGDESYQWFMNPINLD